MLIWTDEIEEICERLRLNCVNLSEYHRKRYYYYKGYSKYFTIPLIILASINSTASVGLQPYLEQSIISGITCLIGMTIGVIGSIELYLGVESSQELEFKQSKDFYTIAIELFKVLNLRRDNREISGKEYLNEQYSKYIKLCEASNLLIRRMKSDLLTQSRDGFSDGCVNNSSSGEDTPPSLDFGNNKSNKSFRFNRSTELNKSFDMSKTFIGNMNKKFNLDKDDEEQKIEQIL